MDTNFNNSFPCFKKLGKMCFILIRTSTFTNGNRETCVKYLYIISVLYLYLPLAPENIFDVMGNSFEDFACQRIFTFRDNKKVAHSSFWSQQ